MPLLRPPLGALLRPPLGALLSLLLLGLLLVPGAGRAAAVDALPTAERFALVIGNNAPGEAQTALRFAEADARSFAGVLTELAGFPPENVAVLVSPNRRAALAALDTLAAQVELRAAQGLQTVFTFYYSGHARADALDFGPDRLELDTLRAHLEAIPATMTLVVLDACRSGAFSRVKGAAPATDFSINSISRLNTRGMVVMASSSAGELSQESEALGGSFFTHHLLVGLRGAADTNVDGFVSVNEAYRFAYNQTLQSTARTAVGRQHVTFETRLAGKGDVPLTAPAARATHLLLGADLAGDLMVSAVGGPQPVVLAEIHKLAGSKLKLTVAPGPYEGLLREGERLWRCPIEVVRGAVTVFERAGCVELERATAAPKGVDWSGIAWTEGWGLELMVGSAQVRTSDYIKRLERFGYEEQTPLFTAQARARVTKRVTEHVELSLGLRDLAGANYRLQAFGESQRRFEFRSVGLPLLARGRLPLWDGLLVPYVQAGAGLAIAWQSLEDAPTETQFGYVLSSGAGLLLMPFDHIGFLAEFDVSYAPVLENLLGDVHDHGGTTAMLGLRGAL